MKAKRTSNKGKYVKAKTPEARKKQTAAIIDYYAKKRAEKKKEGRPW